MTRNNQSGAIVTAGLVVGCTTAIWYGCREAVRVGNLLLFCAKVRGELEISPSLAHAIQAELKAQMAKSLADRASPSSILMLPSWLTRIPEGTQQGPVVAVDFGGTSFRVMRTHLDPTAAQVDQPRLVVDIPPSVYSSTSAAMYSFIARKIVKFLEDSDGVRDQAPGGLQPEAVADNAGATGNLQGAQDAVLDDAAFAHVREAFSPAAPDPEPSTTGDVGFSAATAAQRDEGGDVADGAARGAAADASLGASEQAGGGDVKADAGVAKADGDAQGGVGSVELDGAAAGDGEQGGAKAGGEPGAGEEGAGHPAAGEEAGGERREGGGGAAAAAVPIEEPIGFCFSFPMQQTGICSGSLMRWTKGFDVVDGIGDDPVQCLEAALAAAGRPGRVTALMNDSVAVLAAGRFHDSNVAVSVILGTGTNCSYVERAAQVHPGAGIGDTAVNTEWGGFDCDLLPRCSADWELDEASFRPGQQRFEKLVGGYYLGEVARRLILSGVTELDLLPKAACGRLATPGTLTARHLRVIDADDGTLWNVGHVVDVVMLAFGLRRTQCTLQLCWLVKQMVQLVVTRAATLVATGLAAVIARVRGGDQRLQSPVVAVAVEGSVYHQYEAFRTRVHGTLQQLLQPVGGQVEMDGDVADAEDEAANLAPQEPGTFTVRFVPCHDEACLGAAVIAASEALKA